MSETRHDKNFSGFLLARDLHKTYYLGKTVLQVLKGVDFSAQRGEVVSVVGASGAGKSTLLHLLGGLDEPTKGSVTMDGTDVFGLSSASRARLRSRKIGFVFQAYHLLNEMNALENVTLAGRLSGQGAGEATQKARECLEAVGLGARLAHRPAELSGGEQQRVAVARALMNNPELLLADEPTGNLDSKTGDAIIELLLNLQKQRGMTLVIVTHDHHIGRRAQRTVEIADGKIIKETRNESVH
jgi:predicted ABC-type transport system involved in lysophospholipase L1 biosynthesis ATPase subunit